jgi:hypothetical protein
MAEYEFRAKVRPELHPAAQELVDAYESVPGGKTYPCLPEGIAAVLEHILKKVVFDPSNPGWDDTSLLLEKVAALLRGEKP